MQERSFMCFFKTIKFYVHILSTVRFYSDLKHTYEIEGITIIPRATVFLIKFAFHLSVIDG